MFAALLLVSGAKAVAYVAVSVVVGAGLGYGFRGKVNKGLHAVGADAAKAVQSAATDVAKKV